MNFFEAQDNARSSTTKLLIFFVLAVVTLVVMTNLSIMGVFIYFDLAGQPITWQNIKAVFDWELFAWLSLGVVIVIASGSLYKTSQLAAGGKVVAESLGGQLVSHSSRDPQQQMLLNVVEEMAIASGTPVPNVYLLKNESAINAFAAGFDLNDAVIGVTQGALEHLERDELQGVIAHEFSHIINGDMRLNMRLLGVLHGILLIALIGYYIMRASARGRSKKGNQLALMGLGFVVIGYTGEFFGKLIKASVSRQREYLADASAVQFTRNNLGIANALKKVAGISEKSHLQSPEAHSFSHAFFSDAIKSRFSGMFSTHPPIEQRIKQLDPLFRGKIKPVASSKYADSHSSPAYASFSSPQGQPDLVASIGSLDETQIHKASVCISQIPQAIKQKLYDCASAEAAMYALVATASNDSQKSDLQATKPCEQQRTKQCDAMKQALPEFMYEEFAALLPHFERLADDLRLPIIEIALPNLRAMSKVSFVRFKENLQSLIDTDAKISVYEWVAYSLITHYLSTEFEGARQPTNKHKDFKKLEAELNVYLKFISQECAGKSLAQASLRHQLEQGTSLYKINVDIDAVLSLELADVRDFSHSVETLNTLYPKQKQQLLYLSYFLMTNDAEYCSKEQALMRAIAEVLNCPMPIV